MDPQQIEFDSDLTCQYCGLILSSKSAWSSHIHTCKERTTKAEDSQWCCFRCGVVKSNEEQLRGHQRWCGKFRCYKCGETKQNEAALKVHRRRCFEKKIYKCNSCKRCFRAKSAMIEHAAQHINENLPCDFCAKSFESKGKLERHIREVHFKIRNRSIHTCTICSKNFKSRSNLRNHLNIHTGEKNHLCYLCGNRFVDPGTLRKHMRHVHAETRAGQPVDRQMLQCEKCGKSFGSRTGYARHVDKIHGNGKPECSICGKRVSGNEMLAVHMNAAHNKVKPYECKTCGGLYTTPNYLKVHMRIHSGENFQCKFCKKTFLQVACLNRHYKTVHPDENRDSGAYQSSL
uniref:Zinc finger protein 26 n=1 Tax=Cacopsylla melanoneura TaxID=428564 RepID=A0A8D8LC95_9HEMI